MSNDPLLANLNAFKNKVKSAPVITSVKRSNSNSNSPSKKRQHLIKDDTPVLSDDTDTEITISNKSSPLKKSLLRQESSTLSDAFDDNDEMEDDDGDGIKKIRPGSIAAQALQIGQNEISKSHDSSKLLWATEYIQKKGKPVLLNELTDYISIKSDDKIIDLLKKLEKIQFDSKKNSFKYISTYDVHSAQELLNLLRSQVTFKGISCKELKDGWPQCDETINELEEDSKILVLRTKKDKTPRYVWYNNGGDLNRIDEDFIKMWENVQLPQFAELPRKLQDLGLKPASIDPATIKRQTKKVEIKKKKQRRGKITNTHMTGILKDYSHRV